MLTPEQIAEMRQDANRYGAANCWTGTSGKLAAHIYDLLTERERLLAELAARGGGVGEATCAGQAAGEKVALASCIPHLGQ